MKNRKVDRKVSLRVLIADDSERDAELIIRHLKKAGYSVYYERANTAKRMKAALGNQGWDLVISEYKLRRFDAPAALALFKKAKLDIPFIVISGTVGEDKAVELMKAGADDYVMKKKLIRLAPVVKRELAETQLRRKHKKVDEENLLLAQAVKSTRDCISITDLENNILFVNDSFAGTYGYSEAELVGKNISIVRSPGVSAEEITAVQSGTLSRGWHGEILNQRKDGTEFLVELWTSVIKNKSGGPIALIGVARDITRRKQAEEALAMEQFHMSMLMDNVPDHIYFKDKESRFIRMNKSHAARFGLSDPAEALGKTDFDFFTEQHARPAFEDEQKIIQTGQPLIGLEEKETWPDGSITWVTTTKMPLRDKNGEIIGTFGISKDITNHKQVEEAIRESEERFRMVFENAFDGISIYEEDPDPFKRKLVECNEKYAAMSGRRREELLKIGYTKSLQIKYEGLTDKAWLESLTTKDVYRGSFSWNRPDEKDNIIEYVGVPIIWRGKTYSIGIDRDITEHKRAEETLRENEKLFRDLFNASPDAIVLIDPHDPSNSWPIVDCNEAACQMNGYMREELIGHSIDALNTTVGTQEERAAYLQNVRRGGIIHLETSHRHKDGHIFPVEVSTSVVTLGGREMVLGIDRDITERKQTENELHKSEAQLSNAIKIAKLGPWEYDVVKDVFTFNDSFFAIFRTTAKQVGGYTMSSAQYAKQFVYPDDLPLVGEEIKKAVETTDPNYSCQLEHRIIYADGTMGYIAVRILVVKDAQGRTIKTFGVNQDITERKQAEESLAEEQYLLNILMDNVPDHIYFKDKDGHFLRINNDHAKKFGLSNPALAIGKSDFDFFTEEHARPAFEDEQTIIRTGKPIVDIEEKETWPDGRETWVSTTKMPLRDKEGNIIGTFGVSRDITERKHAEKALRESQALYHSFVEHLPAGVFRKDREGRYIFVNSYFCRLKGLKPDEILGKTPFELARYESEIEHSRPPEMQGIQRTLADEGTNHHTLIMETGKPIELEEVYPQPDGSVKYFQVVKSPVFASDGKIIGTQGVQFDITERKLAENARHVSEKLFRDLFNVSPDAIVLIDPHDPSISWPIVDCNEAACRMNGYTREELVGHSIDVLNPTEGTREERESYMKNLRRKGAIHVEIFHRHKDGHIFPIEVSTTLITLGGRELVLGIDRDITERRRAEEELKESEERYRRLVEFSPDAIAVLSEGKIVYVNPAAMTLLGAAKASDLTGKPILDIIHPDYRDSFHEHVIAVMKEDYAIPLTEQKFTRLDGSFVEVEVAALPIVYKEKSAMQIVARDISGQIKLQNQLLQTQKIQSLGTLAGGIAHDFNNILGIILAYSSLLRKNKMDPEKFETSTTAINQAVQRGASLVRQILTFARKTDIVFEPMDISEMINELHSMLEQTFPKTITFSENIASGLPFILADRTQVHQAILNLCINARDAMPNGGSICIAAEKLTREQMTQPFPAAGEEAYVCLAVSDSGTGMDEATRMRVFDPFFTTKEKGKGTGLGLSVVYGVVQAHHGFIDLKSEPDHGTTFRLFFPVPTVNTQAVGFQQSPESFEIGGNETILFVEDEELLIQMVSFLLESKGYKVLCARNGLEAVSVYQAHANEIALVLTDMGLPVMTGTDEFKKIKEMNPHVKVIFASGYFEPEIKSELLKDGANGFIQKPYDPNDILRIVRQALDQKV